MEEQTLHVHYILQVGRYAASLCGTSILQGQ